MLTSLRRYLVPVAIAWVVAAAVLVLQLWPNLPSSPRQWALLLGFGPPLFVIIEAWSSWVLAESRVWARSRNRISVLRIILLVPVVLFYVAVAWWFTILVGPPT